MASGFPVPDVKISFLRTILEESSYDAAEFLSVVSAVTRIEVSRVIRTAADARVLLNRLEGCKTRAQAVALLKPLQEGDGLRTSTRAAQRDVEAAKAAWQMGYTGYERVLDVVSQQLRSYALEWNPSTKYVPLTSVIQSSGWGKSRLVHQLWSRDMFVFYISCLKPEKTGYPRRTGSLADILSSGVESSVIALLSSIMSVLTKSSKSCLEWMQWQEDGGCHAEVLKEYELLKDSFVTPVRTGDGAGEELKHYDSCFESYKGFFLPSLQKLVEQGKFLLLCVDEAMDLTEARFVQFRRALKFVPGIPDIQRPGFFAVVLGTDSTVSRLAAAFGDDPSSRVRFMSDNSELYDPIWLVGRSDVLVTSDADAAELVDTSAEKVMQYGRPLWAAYLRSLSPVDDKVSSVVALAKKKLLGGEVDLSGSNWVTREVTVAVLGTLIGLDVVAWGRLPQQAAAGHMRTIVNISRDGRRVYTSAAAEPALAAAAAELLHRNVCAFVERLSELCADGLVVEGVRGEMAVRLVMLLAMHECTKRDKFIKPIPLRTYLATMYGAEAVEELEKCAVDMNHNLFFNYFVATTDGSSDESNREYYKRNAASISKRNGSAQDLQMPAQGVVDGAIRTVAVQVINLRRGSKMRDAAEKIKQLFSAVHNVGSDIEEVRVEDGILLVEGLGGKFLGEGELRNSLKRLAKTCEDALREVSESERKVVEELIPLGYKRMRVDGSSSSRQKKRVRVEAPGPTLRRNSSKRRRAGRRDT